MNKISVFGSTGFIGSRFCEMFSGDVISIPRDNILALTPSLLWFISTTNNYHVFDDVQLDIDTNLSLTVEALDKHRKKYGADSVFNLISTWFVYGDPVMLPVREDSCCTPKGFYAITAHAREQLVISYCETFGMSYRIMRLGNVLGVGDKKISLKKNALQYFVREIVNNRPVNLYWPDRTIRDYIYVDDVCSAIDLIISNEKTKNNIYNIGNGIPVKFGDCVESVANKLGYSECIQHVERSDFHKVIQTNVLYLDNSKIQYLGYKPTKTIWQMLDELVEYYTKEKDE
jgi:nucleoside-diphosphate-sugar epimerase